MHFIHRVFLLEVFGWEDPAETERDLMRTPRGVKQTLFTVFVLLRQRCCYHAATDHIVLKMHVWASVVQIG